MPSPPDSEPGRRLLIAAGTAHFENLADLDLLRVPEELERITASFSALGYERQQAALSYDPDSAQLQDMFESLKSQSRAEDVVVAYYTGHGVRDPERFYLLARDSVLTRLDRTAIPAEDLARALTKGSNASQVLVILDACYAGAAAAEFAQVAGRVAAILGDGPAVFVMAAARPKQEADEGALSSALAEALANDNERLGGRVQAFLAMDDVMESVDSYLRRNHSAQTATWSSANVRGRCRTFPNPRYRPEVHPGLDLETLRAFAEHWVPKARGAELGAGGWYFTGREQALRELSAWLSTKRSDGRARVVTGGPGCGKSAVLARIVTLADPNYRREVLAASRSVKFDPATLPPEGVVSVAVHSRHKLLAEVTAQIAAGMGLAARDPADLVAALARRVEKSVIVVDAVDEADDRDQIASQLLQPLAKLPKVFLLVGTRTDSSEHGRKYRALGEATVEIDLDDPRYIGANDVARYVERRLIASEEPGRLTPYRDSPLVARVVARAVAERAHNVFLVAHTAVHTLLTAESIVDVNQPGWVERLPTGIDNALSQFLSELGRRRPDGLSSEKARAVLLPLAFAEGEGLPWVDLWAAVATALSGSDVPDTDIKLVREHAAAFIVEAVAQDRSVYRLYHEGAAEHLCSSVGDARQAQQRIVEALRARVPESSSGRRPNWTGAHPYVVRHLAAHALKAGMLAEFVADGTFLGVADPLRILQALSVSADPQTRRAYDCYSIAFDWLRDAPASDRLSYLQMAARQQGYDSLAETWGRGEVVPRWTVPWARWLPVAVHRAISVHTTGVWSFGTLDGRPVMVSGGDDGTVRVWDLASGAQRGEPLRGHEGSVHSVGLGTLDDRPVIVSGGFDGTVRTWDLTSGAQRGEPLRGHKGMVLSVALGTLDDRPVMVSGGEDGTVRVWDLASGAQRGEPLRGHRGSVGSVTLGTLDGRPVIVSGGGDGTVRIWDLASGAQRGEPLRGHEAGAISVALGTLDGRPVIVSGGLDGTVRIWDPASGAQRGEPLLHEDWVLSVALGTLDGQPVIVSGGTDGILRMWDLALGAPRCEPLRGHLGEPLQDHRDWVRSVALGELYGRPVIVSGAVDGTVRVWDVASGVQRGEPLQRGDERAVYSVALGELDGRPVIVSGGFDGTVRVWDLASGVLRGKPLRGHEGRVHSVALGELDGRPVIVSGGADGTVRVWDAGGNPIFNIDIGSEINALAVNLGAIVVGALRGLLLLLFSGAGQVQEGCGKSWQAMS